MAIAALSSLDSARDARAQSRHARVIRTAVQFACGHALMLGAGVCLALTLGWMLPAAFASGAERLGGAVLVLLGAAGCWSTLSGKAYGHIHSENDGRSRWHLHLGTKASHPRGAHGHPVIPTAIGALFAISSLRAMVLLAPMGASLASMALPMVLLLVVLFGLGILLSMSLFGVVLARVLSLKRLESLGRSAGLLVAAASVVFGLYWVVA